MVQWVLPNVLEEAASPDFPGTLRLFFGTVTRIRVEEVDPETHAAFVIARVLDRGTLRSVGALLRCYGKDRIRSFFREGGIDRVSRRTVPLWLSFLELTPDECTPRPSLRSTPKSWR